MIEIRRTLTRRALAALACALLALPAAAADMNKVIRHVFPVAETGFDPQAINDLYSGTVVQVIFETLLTYDYLARPVEARPEGRRGAAADHRRRQDLHVPDPEGRLLHPGPRVQGREAGAGGERFRVLAEAPGRPRSVRPTRSWSRARSSASTRRRKPRRRAASSTTMRRSRGSRSSTATRCASGSRRPITGCRTCSRTSRPPPSHAR